MPGVSLLRLSSVDLPVQLPSLRNSRHHEPLPKGTLASAAQAHLFGRVQLVNTLLLCLDLKAPT